MWNLTGSRQNCYVSFIFLISEFLFQCFTFWFCYSVFFLSVVRVGGAQCKIHFPLQWSFEICFFTRWAWFQVLFYNSCCSVCVCVCACARALNSITGLFHSILGKRLGKSMAIVAKEVKAMSLKEILKFEKDGEVTFATHCLKLPDIKVHCCFLL